MKLSEQEARPRTKSEREAYVTGYASAIVDIQEKGVTAAKIWMREMALLDGLLTEEDLEKLDGRRESTSK